MPCVRHYQCRTAVTSDFLDLRLQKPGDVKGMLSRSGTWLLIVSICKCRVIDIMKYMFFVLPRAFPVCDSMIFYKYYLLIRYND